MRNPWNVLDGVIVVTSIVTQALSSGDGNADQLSFIRTLRVLRALRPLRVVKRIRAIPPSSYLD